jgi:hypothetical protein
LASRVGFVWSVEGAWRMQPLTQPSRKSSKLYHGQTTILELVIGLDGMGSQE